MTYFNKALYVGTRTGLFVLNKNQFSQIHLPQNLSITAIKAGPDHSLYISDLFHLYKMRHDSVKEYKLPVSINENTDDYFNDFLIDEDNIWLACKNGVCIMTGDSYSVMNVHNGLRQMKSELF